MTSTTQISALDELMSRAGASDVDREQWLRERMAGVTATQIRELYLQGAGYRAALIKSKVEQILEPWLNNRYVAWGNTREPIIAQWCKYRFGIEPETRIFRAADNPRFLASPDGVGQNFLGGLLISEIKTGKDDIAPGTEAYRRKGYWLQMIWGMRVTGARRCLYAWEQHDSDWQERGAGIEQPMPLGEPKFAWIDYDEAIGKELEDIAVEFLHDLDAALRDAADGVTAQIDDELDTHAVNYLRFIGLEKEATTAKKAEWEAMQSRLEGCDALSQEGPIARVTYNPGVEKVSSVPDVEAAKLADPALFAEVAALSKRWNDHQAKFSKTVTTTGKPSLTVTAIKQKEASK